jgi:hypothetical protein
MFLGKKPSFSDNRNIQNTLALTKKQGNTHPRKQKKQKGTRKPANNRLMMAEASLTTSPSMRMSNRLSILLFLGGES